MDKNSLAASRIKHLRIKKNILQKAIALHLGLSENAYSRIENGHTQISISNLYLICEALNCPIEEILDIDKGKITHNNSNVVLCQFNEGTFQITLAPNDFITLKELLESKK